jgi:anthranilate synthase component 2
MILLIDNYDSFSYNLFQMVGTINPDIRVIRNDEISLRDIEALSPSRLILSPGPGRPEQAGICVDAIRHFAGQLPILGVCLGHQAICTAYGATVSYAKTLMHGKQSDVLVDTVCRLFSGLPAKIKAGRYHSLAALENTLPLELVVTAKTDDGEIMAVRHRDHPVFGVQFHPESILTPEGKRILANFLNDDPRTGEYAVEREAVKKIKKTPARDSHTGRIDT